MLGFVVLSCAFLFEKGFSLLTIKSKELEEMSQGKAAMLIKDGVLQLDKMNDTGITPKKFLLHYKVKAFTILGKLKSYI